MGRRVEREKGKERERERDREKEGDQGTWKRVERVHRLPVNRVLKQHWPTLS